MARLIQRARNRLSKRMRQIYAGIDTPPVLEIARYFPEHAALLADFDALRAEALALFAAHPDAPRMHELSATQWRLSARDGKNWRMVMIKSYGHTIRANAALTPTLNRFLRAHPQVTTAAISWLDPGKHIPRHRGPFRGILRYHLCLYAPDCGSDTPPWLAVDGQTIPYREGGDLLWDDTFAHEVRNPGPNPRIAILLDLRRPVNGLALRALFRAVMAAGWLASVLHERRMRLTRP